MSPVKQRLNLFKFSILHWTSNCPVMEFMLTLRERLGLREEDKMSWSQLLCGALISRYLKAPRSERSTPSLMETRAGETGKVTVSRWVRCSPELSILVLVLSFTVRATPRFNSHSRDKSLSGKHHVKVGRHALCRPSRRWWDRPYQTTHARKRDFCPTRRFRFALDFGSFRR